MRKGLIALLGFVLLSLGLLSIVFSIMGLQFSFLMWMDRSWGFGFAFLVRLFMVLVGFVLMYVGLTDWRRID